MGMSDAVAQYERSLRLGQRYVKSCLSSGKYPYLQVLDEILDDSLAMGRMDLGVLDIPSELIVGTKHAERKLVLTSNFLPLLPADTEFAAKWIHLCESHLGEEGIQDPIFCFEYLGRFYVQEGHKRVSVLRSYGAPAIPAHVVRVLPTYSDSPEIQTYYEFLEFFRLTKLYGVQFHEPGHYGKLLAALGYDAQHVWSEDERREFSAYFIRFEEAFHKRAALPQITPADALLVWLRVYPFHSMADMDAAALAHSLESVWPDVRVLREASPIAVDTAPIDHKQGLLSKLVTPLPSHLRVAFIYADAPAVSPWAAAHDLGRQYLERKLADKVETAVYTLSCESGDAESLMEQAVADGAALLFATAPPLISACLKIAARYPEVRVLNCALSMPYASVRTYYCRMYEAKYITGAIAGAMSREDWIGYVANYPIFGVPASINAFALGARLTNPSARILLRWSCLPGNPLAEFDERGISVISNRDTVAGSLPYRAWDWGTYQRRPDGSLTPLSSPCWDWGRFYEKVVESVLDGSWNAASARAGEKAVNYWWGITSGVLDVQLSPELPDGVRQLASYLKQGLLNATIDPFRRLLTDQSGLVHNEGDRWLPPDEILGMDWLCDNVEGAFPPFDELLPQSRELVRLLGVYRDRIPPDKESAPL